MTRSEFTLSKIKKDCIDEKLFEEAVKKCTVREFGANGIGTLAEKSVHAVLKYYYVPDESRHEIKVLREEEIAGLIKEGKDNKKKKARDFVADACMDGEIYEIQTKAFYKMRDKLTLFLKEHDVTIVYPVSVTKYVRYINKETGEIEEPKKSPQKGSVYDIVPELYGIKDLLGNEHLHFIICFIESDEYRIFKGFGQRGKKTIRKNTEKADRIPRKILGEIRINTPRELLGLLPDELPEDFTNRDIADATGFHISYAELLTNILCSINLLQNKGHKGRYKVYNIV